MSRDRQRETAALAAAPGDSLAGNHRTQGYQGGRADTRRGNRLCPAEVGSDKRHRFRDEGRARFESHPRCERPRVRRCMGCRFRILVRCASSRRRACAPCSETYRRCVYQVAVSGFLIVGRGEKLFLTLTAPGQEAHADTVHGGICPCTPVGGVALAAWNARLPKRWNRFMQQLRRRVGCKLAYFRAIETQRRGALHEHVMLCSADPARPLVLEVESVRALAIAHGYGHSIRLDVVSGAGGAAGYVSKYVSKACDERSEIPWVNEETGEVMRARYRPWSASRDWGTRMGTVREAQKRWAAEQNAGSLDNNTNSYTTEDADLAAPVAVLRAAGLLDGGG